MIDAHVHLFPDAATGRAWQEAVGFEAVRPGTTEDLLPRMKAAGIRRAVVLLFPRSVQLAQRLREEEPALDEAAIRRRQVASIQTLNRWGTALAAADERFVAFVGADASVLTADELMREVESSVASGARGVKILPGAMRMYPDDPRLEPVFATCEALDVPVLSQSGSGGRNVPGDRGPFGAPAGFRPVMTAHPRLRLVLAHLGRGLDSQLVELMADYPTVRSDTSLRLGSPHDPWEPDAVRALIKRVGPERVLFGTNYPLVDPVEYARRLDELGLTPAERERLADVNARELLGG